MPESPAALLRRAAEKMRGLAQAAIDAGWSGATQIKHAHDGAPLLVSADNLNGIADVVTDDYANLLAALGNPTMGLLIADQWDAIADVMGFEQRVSGTSTPSFVETKALAAARAFLGEEADADA